MGVTHHSVLSLPSTNTTPSRAGYSDLQGNGSNRSHVFAVPFSWRTSGILHGMPGLSGVVLPRLLTGREKTLNATEGKLG